MRWWYLLACLLAAPALSLVYVSSVRADELLEESLHEKGRAPWYDSESNEIVPIELAPSEPRADYRSTDWQWPEWQADSRWEWPDLSWLGPILWYTIWAVIIVGLVGLLYFIMRAILQTGRRQAAGGAAAEWNPAKIEELPFELANRPDDLVESARQARARGDLRLTVILLFSEQLLHLDRTNRIRLAKGKTNRQYLRELAWDPPLRQLLRKSVHIFEHVYFGGWQPTREEADTMWEITEELHARCQEPAALAMAH